MLNELILHTVEKQREDSVCACVVCVCVCGRDNVDDGTSRGQLLGFSYFCYLHVLLVNLATYLKKKLEFVGTLITTLLILLSTTQLSGICQLMQHMSGNLRNFLNNKYYYILDVV